MGIFIGSNAGDTITPDLVSPNVIAIGGKKPSSGSDLITAGNGNDVVAGGGGDDLAFLGGGDDTFLWKSGDGNDIVDGGSGVDRLVFSGASVAENIAISTGLLGLAQVTRSVGNVTMTLSGMERIDIAALDGQDRITVNDLSRTDVKDVFVNLAGAANPAAGDGAADVVSVNGTTGADVITISPNGTSVTVSGLAATTTLEHSEATDQLVISAGSGNDVISAFNGLASLVKLTLDGGAGNDTITGGDGADLLLGGDGNDLVTGGRGNDTAVLGNGNDTFTWNPGDGNDIVEGNAGTDTLQFNGSNASEDMALSANGSRAILTRNIANITMDLSSVEIVNIAALGGTDNIAIGDMTGTGVKEIHVDLAAFDGADDGAIDVVTVGFTAGDDAIAFNVQAGPAVVTSLGGAKVFVDNQGVGDRLAIDGGAGNDSATASGTAGDDVITLAPDGTGLAVFAEGGQPISVTNIEHLRVEGGAGNDIIRAFNGIANLTQLTLDGGSGNDTLTGGDGNDLLLGGEGNDLVNGGRGNDTAILGNGDDTFTWNPGDGNDIVEGGTGNDTLQFNGSNAGENMALSANGSRAVLTRNIANITMDLDSVEIVNIRALGAVDNIAIGDMTGTGVKEIHVNLSAFDGADDGSADVVTVGFTAGDDIIDFDVAAGPAVIEALGGSKVFVDGQAAGDRFVIDGGAGNDSATANGTAGDDIITLAPDGTGLAVFAEGGQVISVTNIEQLRVAGGAGNDVIRGFNGISTLAQLTLDGGAGNDILTGGDGNDLLIGGEGDDLVAGGRGNDTALLGNGDDTFTWNPGDGNDIVEGGAGHDTLQFNGSNAGENMAISANGAHAILTRNIANITMDLRGMEVVNIRALGAVDNIAIGDMTGTGVNEIHVDLGSFDGSDDGAADVVTVGFTNGDDVIDFAVHAGPAVIEALGGTQVFVEHQGVGDRFLIDGGAGIDSATASGTGGDDIITLAPDGTGLAVFAENGQVISVTNIEHLRVEGGEGNDVIRAFNGIANLTQLTIDGGAGNDTITGGDGADLLIGGEGDDLVAGGRGNDTAMLGSGNDTFTWNPGDGNDVVEGGVGHDTLQFNGSNASEDMVLSANGSRALLTRNIANITMDLNDVEVVNVAALGGTDNITVNDMSGTGVTQVNLDLGAFGGGGDAQVDNVTINGTSGNDAITLFMRDGALVVGGLAAEVVIKNFDPNDVIHIAGLGGDDVVDASALGTNGPKIALDGGEGDDVLIGGAGDDLLSGGEDDDILLGGPGLDSLDGGPGDNILIQDGAAVAPAVYEFPADPTVPDHDPVLQMNGGESLM